jgi:hypothetical protein
MYRYVIFTAATLLSAVTAVYADPPASTAVARSGDSRDRIVCRRHVRTGSLADVTRICKTQREWDQEQESIRARGESANSCRNSYNGGQC